MGVPYVLTFVHSLQLSVFCIKRSPPFLLAIWVHVIESCHTVGLSLLVFRILPSIDNVTGLFLLNGVCIVPAVMNLFSSHRGLNRTMKTITFVSDIASVLMQLCVCFIPWILPSKGSSSSGLTWLLPLALLLISMGYWESFMETRLSKKRAFLWFQHAIRSLKKSRPKIYVTASLLKLFVLVLTAVYSLPPSIDRKLYWQIFERIPIGYTEAGPRPLLGADRFDQQSDLFRVTYEVYIPLLVQVFSSCLCYYTGRIACKVRLVHSCSSKRSIDH